MRHRCGIAASPSHRRATVRCDGDVGSPAICPAFGLTDYKVLGLTLPTAVLDLKNDSSIRGQDEHKKFCSLYVQLSRPQSRHGLHLLRKIDMSDLRCRPHGGLVAEMERLRALEQNTMAVWAGQ